MIPFPKKIFFTIEIYENLASGNSVRKPWKFVMSPMREINLRPPGPPICYRNIFFPPDSGFGSSELKSINIYGYERSPNSSATTLPSSPTVLCVVSGGDLWCNRRIYAPVVSGGVVCAYHSRVVVGAAWFTVVWLHGSVLVAVGLVVGKYGVWKILFIGSD